MSATPSRILFFAMAGLYTNWKSSTVMTQVTIAATPTIFVTFMSCFCRSTPSRVYSTREVSTFRPGTSTRWLVSMVRPSFFSRKRSMLSSGFEVMIMSTSWRWSLGPISSSTMASVTAFRRAG